MTNDILFCKVFGLVENYKQMSIFFNMLCMFGISGTVPTFGTAYILTYGTAYVPNRQWATGYIYMYIAYCLSSTHLSLCHIRPNNEMFENFSE